MNNKFNKLPLSQKFLNNIALLGFEKITDIQSLVLCCGVAKRPQLNSLSHGVHIIVGMLGEC